MKMRVAFLPILVLLAFGYSASVLDRTTEHGTQLVKLENVKAQVKSDLAKFTPSTTLVYNQ